MVGDDQVKVESQFQVAPARRVGIHYAILVAATVAVFGVRHRSRRRQASAHPVIAGGYAVSSGQSCLGTAIQLAQSGKYVTLSNAQSSVSGELTLNDARLTGTVNCIGGSHASLHSVVAAGLLGGTVGLRPVRAVLKSSPPRPRARRRCARPARSTASIPSRRPPRASAARSR